MHRRSFLTGIAAALAAPYVVRSSGVLMPIKSFELLETDTVIEWKAVSFLPLPKFVIFYNETGIITAGGIRQPGIEVGNGETITIDWRPAGETEKA